MPKSTAPERVKFWPRPEVSYWFQPKYEQWPKSVLIGLYSGVYFLIHWAIGLINHGDPNQLNSTIFYDATSRHRVLAPLQLTWSSMDVEKNLGFQLGSHQLPSQEPQVEPEQRSLGFFLCNNDRMEDWRVYKIYDLLMLHRYTCDMHVYGKNV